MANISLSYPASWLTIFISVKTFYWVEVFSWLMTEINNTNVYSFNFNETPRTDYVYSAVCSWYDTLEGVIYKDQDVGSSSLNLTGVTWSLTNISKALNENKKAIIDQVESWKQELLDKFNETNSHIDLVKTDINDKIESIEIPEIILEEKEAKKTQKQIDKLDKKITSYIESEMKEKEELNAISLEFAKQEMEDLLKEKQRMEEEKQKEEEKKKKEEEDDMEELELIKQEFERQEEEDRIEKKKELEKELEETLKEVEELKKELKTL